MPKNTPLIRIGTRGSLLARAQSGQILRMLQKKHPAFRFKLVIIQTTGDEFQSVELFRQNKTGVFTKEIEKKLLSGEIDIAVHSLKDLPIELPKGLALGCFPKRLDTRDVLISKHRYDLRSLPLSARVATGSPRRKRQILLARPDLRLFDLRGNLDTRAGRVLKKKDFDAVVLAQAGLLRLKKFNRFSSSIPLDQMYPAVGQAALGVQIRSNDKTAQKITASLNHGATETTVRAERAFLRALHGGCRVPVGVLSKISKNKLFLKARVFSVKDERYLSAESSGPDDRPEKIGAQLAKKLLKMGAKSLLNEARAQEGDA